MNLAIVSHKICWLSGDSPSGYATDGGFPLQMEAISELFEHSRIVVPCHNTEIPAGLSPLKGQGVQIVPLSVPRGEGFRRKVNLLIWLLTNSAVIWREVRLADGVHTPIPGDVGTIGMIFAMMQRKPLFVRHCGNWFVQRTTAERFWKWSMEKFAGGRNVMLATGGAPDPPSKRNPQVRWIFSSSLRTDQIVGAVPRGLPADGKLKMVIACRQEERKGTDIVIQSLQQIIEIFPKASLDVVGGGSLLKKLQAQAVALGLEERVKFHGKVEQSRVTDLLQQADLFCYPTSASEGFPKVVLEALASGLPVITTRVSVLPELIGNGCGILLDSATPDALAAAVCAIAYDKEEYARMSSIAIETARRYTLEEWSNTIGDLLQNAWNIELKIQSQEVSV